jgi:hypothetical protein
MVKLDQWARWRDERLLIENPDAAAAPARTTQALPFAPPAGMIAPPPGVAAEGRRLKRRFSWIPIVFMILFGVLWFWLRSH